MKLRPCAGWVLIEELPEEEKTSVGVYLPETSKDKSVKGKIVKVGKVEYKTAADVGMVSLNHSFIMNSYQDYLISYPPFKEEQIVIFKKWATNEVNDNGKKYVLVKFEDVIGYYK